MATEPDRPNLNAIATIVAVLVLSMTAMVAVVAALVRIQTEAEQSRKGGTVNARPHRDLAAAQRAELNEEAQWVDRQAGTLSIPIDRAMDLVVDELSRDPTAASPQTTSGVTADADGANPNATATKAADATAPSLRGAQPPGLTLAPGPSSDAAR